MLPDTARETAAGVRSGKISAVQVAEYYLERIASEDSKLKAFLRVDGELALSRAHSIDRAVAAGDDPGLLAGVPVAIKDNICTCDIPTTCASKMLENFVPPYNATVIDHLLAEGAVIIGKTNLDEFAMGSSTENSAFGPTRNPWDLSRVPGGSSGGSAAAVAAKLSPLALGSDTGGSIRQPAAFCGICGLKPTYGRVSRYGLIAFASSLDQIGPMAGNIEDCALLLTVIAGADSRDSTCSNRPVPDYVAELNLPLKTWVCGIPTHIINNMSSPLKEAFETAVSMMVDLGVTVREVTLPDLDYALAAYYIIAPAEASSNLARFDGVRYGYRAPQVSNLFEMVYRTRQEGFGAEVKRRIMLGTYVLSSGYYEAYYRQAQRARAWLKQQLSQILNSVDVILMPASPSLPFELGSKSTPLDMYLSDIYTVVVNLTGVPALVVPCHPVKGLPMGLQIIGSPWSESELLRLGYAFEKALQETGRTHSGDGTP